jgi:hypothetical protein
MSRSGQWPSNIFSHIRFFIFSLPLGQVDISSVNGVSLIISVACIRLGCVRSNTVWVFRYFALQFTCSRPWQEYIWS